jgi:glucose dehydrogenase
MVSQALFDRAGRGGVIMSKLASTNVIHTNPMTFMGRNGKQYVVIVSSGLNAFALP